jgi:hypothetical protein
MCRGVEHDNCDAPLSVHHTRADHRICRRVCAE